MGRPSHRGAITGMIWGQGVGPPAPDPCRKRDLGPARVLLVEGQSWRDRPVRRQADGAARGRKCKAEAPVGRCHAG